MALISASLIRLRLCAAGAPGGQVSGFLCSGLGDPRSDRGRACARVERGTVPGELAVELGDLERGSAWWSCGLGRRIGEVGSCQVRTMRLAAVARCSRSRCARGWPTCRAARIARIEGTRSAASSAAKTTAARSPSGSVSGTSSCGPGAAADAWAPRMIIIKSSQEPTSATACHGPLLRRR